jgi:hypothetical protein
VSIGVNSRTPNAVEDRQRERHVDFLLDETPGDRNRLGVSRTRRSAHRTEYKLNLLDLDEE